MNGKAKIGRRRTEADYLKPEKPAFKPLVDRDTWDRVQTKIAAAKQGPKRSAKTDELWLKPFLICGQCGLPMRASKGGEGTRLWPSYYCGSYGTHGRDNPTGCRCHRVRHSVIEELVTGYVKQHAPLVADLLKATQTGNLELAKPILERLRIAENDRGGVWLDMLAFVESRAMKRELKQGTDLDTQYGLVYERVRPKLEADVAKLEAELDEMLAGFRDLSPKLRERANKQMEAKQVEIDQLRRDIADLRIPWAALQGEVEAR
ncbi:MAG: zinc ribbon domain-containing protein, partial [Planctomycetes bacterium]|nr:zinc ribbon domain-containing protein [Planctomycetota bacterium]